LCGGIPVDEIDDIVGCGLVIDSTQRRNEVGVHDIVEKIEKDDKGQEGPQAGFQKRYPNVLGSFVHRNTENENDNVKEEDTSYGIEKGYRFD
jgi:hypothetical protein